MARRSAYSSYLAQRQRAIAAQARAQQRAVREAERARKAFERAQVAENKERRRLYLESRQATVDAMNFELGREVERLEGLLLATLDVDDFLDFETLRVEPELPPFQPGALATPAPTPTLGSFLPAAPSGLGKFLPGAKEKFERASEAARAAYDAAVADHAEHEAVRENALAEAKAAYESDVEKIKARAASQNAEIDEFQRRFDADEPDAIVEYFSLV